MIELRAGETLLAVERRHWLPVVTEAVSIFLAAFLPIFLIIGLQVLPEEARASIAQYDAFAWFLYCTWLLGLWMVFGVSMTNYYLDVLLVTNQRVIDIEQLGLFSRDTAELSLDKIEDIRVEIKGLVASVLGYGNLYIQTAGESQEFSLKHVDDPHSVADKISKARSVMIARVPEA